MRLPKLLIKDFAFGSSALLPSQRFLRSSAVVAVPVTLP